MSVIKNFYEGLDSGWFLWYNRYMNNTATATASKVKSLGPNEVRVTCTGILGQVQEILGMDDMEEIEEGDYPQIVEFLADNLNDLDDIEEISVNGVRFTVTQQQKFKIRKVK